MKKWIILLSSLFCFIQFSKAQSLLEVKRIEYFFNKDTGVSKGIVLPGVIANDTVIRVNALVSVANLPDGIHTMYIRAKSDSGWSQYTDAFFYINKYIVGIEPNIDSAEYFFDHDPGVGNAIPLSVGIADTIITFTKVIPIGNISQGVHTMCIRVKNSNGKWSHFQTQMLYVTNDTNDMPSIISGEYFVDHDPGIGTAQTIKFNFSSAGNTVTQAFNLPVPTGLDTGKHYMYVRVKDIEGHWSHFQDTFRIFTLPLTGLTLAATRRNQTTFLSWYTLTENNTSYFEVEKSINGIEFTQFFNVKSNGNSAIKSEYNFIDKVPASGLNYYRIKEVDKDGKYVYSQIVRVWFDKGLSDLILYPNPAMNLLNIGFKGSNETAIIDLFDAAGRWVKLYRLPLSATLQIDLRGISAGTYTVHVSDGLTEQVGKIIKK